VPTTGQDTKSGKFRLRGIVLIPKVMNHIPTIGQERKKKCKE
jgi:hypothetical protein